MTYDEFSDFVQMECTTTFPSHELLSIHMHFEMSCDADYTDEKRREMDEDEFIEYVTRRFYEIIVDDRKHDLEDCE